MSFEPVSVFVLIAVIIYFAFLAIVSYRAVKKESSYEFSTGNFKVPFLGTWSSLFVSGIDAGGFIFLISLAAAVGFGSYWLVVGIIAAFAIHFLQAPRIKELVREYKFLTINDMIESRIGKLTSFVALLAVTILSAVYAASLLHVSGVIFESVFGLSVAIWIVITAIVVGLYLYFGGYKTVVKTDIVQFIAILVIFGIALFVSDFSSLGAIWQDLKVGADNFSTVLGLILFFFLLNYIVPWTWQRMFTAENTKTLRKSIVANGIVFIPILFAIVLFGATILSSFPDIDPSMILYHLADGVADPVLGLIVSIGLIALTMSSIDTQAYQFLSSIASNWLHIDKEQEPDRYRSTIRFMIIIVFILTTVVAITINDFLTFIINAFTILTILFPVIFISVHSKGATRALDRAMFLSLIIGGAIYFYMLTQGLFTSLLANTIPAFITIGLAIIGWLIVKVIEKR